ncbi:RNA-directed DNA polymerase [Aestuariibaculum sp. YM273]|uniref:RNA-directed DNA polymerase n=1 Tax=Aestuariibaculum sp. YM273 TaxID=3070659 RepID=UPI0027DD3E68|nr:RNA-directed DNA polymerase [Aestuariibaculum sp. YM273]WMI65529.1 RNA-directed DNA polymerase [Aestuariibaculum sp. YM273]
MDIQITLEDVKTAYRKLKSMAYYDTHDLFLKSRIYSFETDLSHGLNPTSNVNYKLVDFEKKLEDFHNELIKGDLNKPSEYWRELYKQITYKVLPKKVKSYNEYSNSNTKKDPLIESIFTNVREISNDHNYELDKLNLFFDAPVEIHLISILWIMKLGFQLEGDLEEKCYGNRLILEEKKANSDKKKVTDDSGLFKPYYKQYQKWRDEGITVAKQFLEKKQDVLFINIDIKDYYYSVRLDFDELEKRLECEKSSDYDKLSNHFKRIHLNYTELLKKVKYPNKLIENIEDNESILPIGLASSYVLANWYLREFDSRVHQNIRPIYYSRYVDDIFIITANPNPNFTAKDQCENVSLNFNEQYSDSFFNSLTDEEQHVIKTLFPVITLEDTPKELLEKGKKTGRIFKLQCYKNLYIQPAKTLVYFFDYDSSLSLLEKFKNEIEQRSSEFRFLPDEKLAENGFDDEAYELVFDDSLHKVKTLKDYKENRYGIASHLSKKIFYSLRNGKTDNKEDVKKILKFFRGTTNLDHFRQWERLLTYFVVNDNKEEFIKFTVNTFEQIFKLPIGKKFKQHNLNYNRIAGDLLEHYAIAMEMVFSLNPSFIEPIQERLTKIFNRFYEEFSVINKRPLDVFSNWQRCRLSNMLRHNYINIPLLNFTELPMSTTLLEPNFSKINLDGIDFKDVLLSYSPRKVRFYEVAWMECIKRVHNTKRLTSFQNIIENDNLFGEDDSTQHYLDEAFEIYFKINYWFKLSDKNFKDKLKNEIFNYGEAFNIKEKTNGNEDWLLFGHEITVSKKDKIDKLRVGLANMKVDGKNYEASMLGKPNLTNRYLQFAKVLNEAEAEACDIVVLPELSLPHGLVKTILENSSNHQQAIVSGIEHWTHNDIAFNFILTVLPCEIRGIKDAVPVLRLKNHYAPSEEFWINQYRRVVPKPTPYRYHLFRWKGLYFTNYYCFELADIVHRSIFRSKIDFLIASEWNRDVNFYANISETTSRDLHCYFIQVNTSDYGDSRVIHPKKTEDRDSLRIKGGKNTTLLVDELDIKALREFQYKGFGLQRSDKSFKPTPADYKHEDARVRQENKSFVKK